MAHDERYPCEATRPANLNPSILMKTQTDESIRLINSLIETCEDGCHGFQVAADDVKDAELQALFQRYSSQRAGFIQELRQLVVQLGGEQEKSGSAPGKLHRGWINLKAALSSNEPHAVLAECERGEDAAVKAYREALEKLEDPNVREVVSRQMATVLATHDSVRDLRDSPMYVGKSR